MKAALGSRVTVARIIAMLRQRAYLLALVWMLALFLTTILVHQPLRQISAALPSPLFAELAKGLAAPGGPLNVLGALALDLRDVVVVLLLILVSGGLGKALIRDHSAFNEIERPALEALLGLGVLSIAVLIVGLSGLYPSTPIALAIMAGLALLLRRPLVAWLQSLAEVRRLLFENAPGGFHRWLRRGILVLLALALLMTFAPPTKWDALTYHLAGPRFYLDAGRIVSFPENHFLGFPQLVEMLYLWLMIAARPQAAGLLHWCFGVLALGLTLGIARRANKPWAGWIAITILLVGDSLWLEFGWPYNDLALLAAVMASLTCLLAWDEQTGSPKLLILTGVYVGLAMGVKYTAAASAVGIGVLTLWLARKQGLRHVLIAGGMVSVSALLVFSPWLVKNTLLDGNPVSPFVWGTRAFDRFDQYYYLRPGTGLDAISLVFAPIQGAVFGREGAAPYGSSTGALLLPLLPLALIGWSRRAQVARDLSKSLVIFVIPAYLIWLTGAATSYYLVQTRLLFPLFPALAIVAALGMEGLSDVRSPVNVSGIAKAITLLALALAVVGSLASFLIANTLPVSLGLRSADDYLSETLGVYDLAMKQVNALPPDAKILFLWEPRAYACARRCVPDSLIDQWWHDRQVEPNPRRIAARWRAEGITHVLIFEDGLQFLYREDPYEPLTAADVAALDQLRGAELKPLWNPFPSYTLYELRASP